MVAGAYAVTEVCFRAVPAGAPRCVVVPIRLKLCAESFSTAELCRCVVFIENYSHIVCWVVNNHGYEIF
jgi:hypothetical protein